MLRYRPFEEQRYVIEDIIDEVLQFTYRQRQDLLNRLEGSNLFIYKLNKPTREAEPLLPALINPDFSKEIIYLQGNIKYKTQSASYFSYIISGSTILDYSLSDVLHRSCHYRSVVDANRSLANDEGMIEFVIQTDIPAISPISGTDKIYLSTRKVNNSIVRL